MDYVTVLLVDDDADLLRLLQRRLERDGLNTIAVESGRQALLELERHLPDLAILDLVMPEMDGFQLADQIKKRGDLPIIFLTSVAETQTRIEGIRRYAEDYLLKPFNYDELLARVRRVLARTAGSAALHQPLIVVDPQLTLDLSQGQAHTSAGVVRLSATEARLLYHLVRHAGQTLPVSTLIAKVWGYTTDTGPEALRVAVHRLRHKLEPDPARPRYILTDRDTGYRFIELRR